MLESLGLSRCALGLSLLVLACGGESSSDGSDRADCSGFDDDPAWSVAVSLRNETNRAIYLGQTMVTCGVEQLFHVSDAAGAPLPEFSSCRQSCENVMQSGGKGCPSICAYPSAITLEPGEATNTLWSGLYRVDLEIPGECTPLQKIATVTCDRAEQIEPGAFTFVSQAGTSVDCSQTLGTCGDCVPNGNGGCTTGAALIAGTLLGAETTVMLDASYGVGDPSGGGPTLPVEIVFRE
jgi:hypothetical protein